MRIDSKRVEINWPIYGYILFAVISVLFNFLSPFRMAEGKVTMGYLIITSYTVIGIYFYYWVKLAGYTRFREANPLIPIMINKGVFLGLYLFMFNSMAINWKIFFISLILELVVGFFYVVDFYLFDYLEEDVTEESEVI